MKIPFWKMHGAGNDFILADNRDLSFPVTDVAWLARIAARRTGVGCDGIALIEPSTEADVRMRFINPDGREAEMCGNGARCVARLAFELGAAPGRMRIQTRAGVLDAEVQGEQVRLAMTPPHDWRMGRQIESNGERIDYAFVNTGVPHTVIECETLASCAVVERGRPIRYHDAFAPKGTNVNFVRVTGPQSLAIRTYERGVEDETLACGTGIVATALIEARLGRVTPPVTVIARSGAALTVDFRPTPTGAEAVTLAGPAAHVYEGVLTYA